MTRILSKLALSFFVLVLFFSCAAPTLPSAPPSPEPVTVTLPDTTTPAAPGPVFTENPALPKAIRDYYRAAYGLSGAALKAKLHEIVMAGHSSGTYAGLWTMYQTTDVAPNGKVWDMYSSTSSDGSTASYWFTFVTDQDKGSGSAEGLVYNREHTWPNSTFGATANVAAFADGHHVTPTDKEVNNKRSNYAYGEVGTPTWTSQNGSKLGPPRAGLGYTGSQASVFEVIDAYKGDIARMHFYMALRYYGDTLFADCDWAAAGARLKPWYDAMLKAWAEKDPVSPKEVARNQAVETYQGNRNPFIDYPELAGLLDLEN
jgi:endonuclease I